MAHWNHYSFLNCNFNNQNYFIAIRSLWKTVPSLQVWILPTPWLQLINLLQSFSSACIPTPLHEIPWPLFACFSEEWSEDFVVTLLATVEISVSPVDLSDVLIFSVVATRQQLSHCQLWTQTFKSFYWGLKPDQLFT